jgi:hypothetical protein
MEQSDGRLELSDRLTQNLEAAPPRVGLADPALAGPS